VQSGIENQDKGSPKWVLVLAPLHQGLLCAIFPASDVPKARLPQSQQETKLQADYISPASSPSESVDFLQEGIRNHQTDDLAAAETMAQSMPPQQFQFQQLQPYVQVLLQQPQAHQDEQCASLNAPLALGDGLVSWAGEPVVTAESSAIIGFGPTGPHVEGWDVNGGLHGEGMGDIGMHDGVTHDAHESFFQSIISGYQCGS
jgi:hypothetical protein